MNIPTPKNMGFSDGNQTQMTILLKRALTKWIKFHQFTDTTFLNKIA
jgi:hypothetical protein